ncbi:MAG: AAA family ATPase [Sandaracinaceae bacterium]|nr:AAA family ATPase [Sandaracinaceae bacterium]
MSARPFVRRVVLRNYKSIAACDLRLGMLTFLVGSNGSGKSNFLDALRLVSDGLASPLDHALRERGGIDDVRRRSTGHPHNFGIRLELELAHDARAVFAFEIAARKNGAFEVKEERCDVDRLPLARGETERASYVVRRGDVVSCTIERPPAAAADRLYLVAMSGAPEFREVFDALSAMSFYNLSPAAIREVQPPDPGRRLVRDGRNLASVIGRLEAEAPESMKSVKAYLAKIAPGVQDVTREAVAHRETLLFRQAVKGSAHPWKFFAGSMSDGTLRALGVLVALAQASDAGYPVPLIGIEEPESAIHPAAATVLLEALLEASAHTQVVVTSHSPDLLESEDVSDPQIVAVAAEEGVTTLGPITDVGRGALRDHLYTAGELLRMGQLEPHESARGVSPEQLDLFAPAGGAAE